MKKALVLTCSALAGGLFAAVVAIITAPPSDAEEAAVPPHCMSTDAMARSLASAYGESVFAAGLSGAGADATLIVITTNPTTGTWTIVERMADGTSCIRASGEDFTPAATVKPGSPI